MDLDGRTLNASIQRSPLQAICISGSNMKDPVMPGIPDEVLADDPTRLDPSQTRKPRSLVLNLSWRWPDRCCLVYYHRSLSSVFERQTWFLPGYVSHDRVQCGPIGALYYSRTANDVVSASMYDFNI